MWYCNWPNQGTKGRHGEIILPSNLAVTAPTFYVF